MSNDVSYYFTNLSNAEKFGEESKTIRLRQEADDLALKYGGVPEFFGVTLTFDEK